MAWSPVTQRTTSPRRSPQSRTAVSRASMVSRLAARVLGVAGLVGALRWARTNVAPSSSARRARPMRSRSAGGRVGVLGGRDERHPEGPGEAAEERRRPHDHAVEAVAVAEAGRRAAAPPPLQRDGRQPPPARGGADRRAAPRLGGSCGRRGLRRQCDRAHHRLAVAEERVRVGDGVVPAAAHAQDPLARPRRRAERLHREVEALDADGRGGGGERLGGPAVGRPGAAGRPEDVAAALGEAQRGEGEHVARRRPPGRGRGPP